MPGTLIGNFDIQNPEEVASPFNLAMKYSAVQNYINGKFVNADSQRNLDIISPIDGNPLSTVPMSTA
jgi:hypothetical protein